VPQEAWRSLAGPQEAVGRLGARLTWGIAVLAFSLAFLATLFICLRVIWTASAGKARALLLVGALTGMVAGIGLGQAGTPSPCRSSWGHWSKASGAWGSTTAASSSSS
jgi:hypothetical protein